MKRHGFISQASPRARIHALTGMQVTDQHKDKSVAIAVTGVHDAVRHPRLVIGRTRSAIGLEGEYNEIGSCFPQHAQLFDQREHGGATEHALRKASRWLYPAKTSSRLCWGDR